MTTNKKLTTNHKHRAQDNRLQVVFNETVVSRNLSADATFGDVARALGRFSRRRYGNPAGTPSSPDDLSARQIKGADKRAELQTARARL
jgi:hypothetical protein